MAIVFVHYQTLTLPFPLLYFLDSNLYYLALLK
jgi:hypothetical protein